MANSTLKLVSATTDRQSMQSVDEPPKGEYFGELVRRRLARRAFLKGTAAAGVGTAVAPVLLVTSEAQAAPDPGSRLTFSAIAPSGADAIIVPPSYVSDVVIRWGDPLAASAPGFALDRQTAAAQRQQFGFNCDFVAQLPLPTWFEHELERYGAPTALSLWWIGFQYARLRKENAPQALLWVNHEYTTGIDMFPGYSSSTPTAEQVEIELAAHGGSIVEIRKSASGAWSYDPSSPFNRRVTAETRIELTGPLAGHPLLQTGEDPLVEANGFHSQAEVLVNTRAAADRLGATRMDRPEDIEVSPVTHRVYIALTNNSARTSVAADAGEVAANPRLGNRWGHVVEITEQDDDNAALRFEWEIFLLCGDPATTPCTYFAGFDPSQVSPISCPDNLDFDDAGNLWIATDGAPASPGFGAWNDGIFAVPTEGPDRGYVRQFLSGVPGCEVASLKHSGDGKTLFAAIQHPGEGAGLPNAQSSWPDDTNLPPRPRWSPCATSRANRSVAERLARADPLRRLSPGTQQAFRGCSRSRTHQEFAALAFTCLPTDHDRDTGYPPATNLSPDRYTQALTRLPVWHASW